MDYRTLLYSLDPTTRLSDLKSGDFNHDRDVSGVEQYLRTHAIDAHIDGDGVYHAKTYHIASKPYIYYSMGNHHLLSKHIVAIVGPRKPSEYAYRVLDRILDVLSDYDVVTISGMAEGVDEYVHRGSIERNIPTIAVLGAGFVPVIHSARRSLVQHIVGAGGLVYSEFRLKQHSTHYTFPQRNRIVAGYSDCVVLPEAAMASGSLITADYALQMKKPLYVVPNSIFVPTSEGTNMLLAEHKAQALIDIRVRANMYFSHSTTANMQGIINDNQKLSLELSQEERLVYDCIVQSGQAVDLGYIMTHVPMSLVDVQIVLSMLEIYGVVRQSSPGIYVS